MCGIVGYIGHPDEYPIIIKGDESVKLLSDHVIEIPEVTEALVLILASVPLQLLSYHNCYDARL